MTAPLQLPILRIPRPPQSDIAAQARAFVEATIRRRELSDASPQRRGAETRRINETTRYLSLYDPCILERLQRIYSAAASGRDPEVDAHAERLRRDADAAHRAYVEADAASREAARRAYVAARSVQRSAAPAADAAALAFVVNLEQQAAERDRADGIPPLEAAASS